MLTGFAVHVCTLPLHNLGCTQFIERSWQFLTSSHFSKGRNCRTGGFPVHSHPRDEEPVQLLLFTFAGLDVHTSDVSGEGVQLDLQVVHQLLLQGRHQQGPNHSYCKCSAFARAKRLTTNANMIYSNLQSRNRNCSRAQAGAELCQAQGKLKLVWLWLTFGFANFAHEFNFGALLLFLWKFWLG